MNPTQHKKSVCRPFQGCSRCAPAAQGWRPGLLLFRRYAAHLAREAGVLTSQGLAPLISRHIEDPSSASPWRFEW
jgi:hypothetical protein